jgi:hypothetical protein
MGSRRERKPRGERKWVVVCLEGDEWEDVASELYNAAADIVSEHSRPRKRIGGSGMVWTGDGGRPSCDELAKIVERPPAATDGVQVEFPRT